MSRVACRIRGCVSIPTRFRPNGEACKPRPRTGENSGRRAIQSRAVTRWRVLRMMPRRTARRCVIKSASWCGWNSSSRVQSPTYGEFGTCACIPTRCSISSAADALRRCSKCCRASNARFRARWLRIFGGKLLSIWVGEPLANIPGDQDRDQRGQLGDRGRTQPDERRYQGKDRYQKSDGHGADMDQPSEERQADQVDGNTGSEEDGGRDRRGLVVADHRQLDPGGNQDDATKDRDEGIAKGVERQPRLVFA